MCVRSVNVYEEYMYCGVHVKWCGASEMHSECDPSVIHRPVI